MRQLIVLLTFFGLLGSSAFSQDVWLQNHFSPNSGCSLSNGEIVNVLINNNSGVVMPSNSINVSYTIDGGSLTQQLLNSNLFPGASWSFTFMTNADLSACGPHVMKVWVTRAGDANQLNDTLQWTVQNDCPIVPGTVQNDTSVCGSGNTGTLALAGWANGTLLGWEYSTDNGANWTNTAVTTTTYTFNNLSQETQYRVVIDGGTCTDDTSGIATVAVQAPPSAGTIAGSDSLCISMASGTLTLSGNSSAVLSWESSDDNGATWNTIANTTTTQNYTSLTTTTLYRELVDGGSCPDAYSDTALIYVEQLTGPATVLGSDSLCVTSASGTLTATGTIGSVSYWESSDDGGSTWMNIANTTTTLNYASLPATTWYRVYTDGGYCPDYFSDTAIIYVEPIPVPRNIAGSDSLCATAASGTLMLTGPPSTVLGWETSTDNGATWTSVANTTSSYAYSGLTATTWFRTLCDGGFCADFYSDTAIVFVQNVTDPGDLTGADSLCILSASGSLGITGNIGPVSYWEFSIDNGATWTNIANTTTTQNYTNLTESTWYRAYTDGGSCPDYYSDTALIFVDTLLIPGTVQGSMAYCVSALSGTLIYGGGTGTIDHWESSADGGATWATIATTNDTLTYTNVISTTLYRVFQNGSYCGGVYSDTAAISIVALTDPGTLLNSDFLCKGDSLQLSITGYTATNFQWQTSSDGFSWAAVPGAVSTTYTATNVTDDEWYCVILNNSICPADTTNSVTLLAVPPPYVDAGTNVTIVAGDSTLLVGMGGVAGIWTPGATLSDPQIPTPIAFPPGTTVYTYAVIDINGCINEDSVTVTVVPPTLFDIKNVITANHDGYNDTWMIVGVEDFPFTKVVVFNIYGKEVYASDDYHNDWKGTWKEGQLPNGTYYYTVIPGGTDTKMKGNLTIMGDE